MYLCRAERFGVRFIGSVFVCYLVVCTQSRCSMIHNVVDTTIGIHRSFGSYCRSADVSYYTAGWSNWCRPIHGRVRARIGFFMQTCLTSCRGARTVSRRSTLFFADQCCARGLVVSCSLSRARARTHAYKREPAYETLLPPLNAFSVCRPPISTRRWWNTTSWRWRTSRNACQR